MARYASSFHFLKAAQSLRPANPNLLMLIGSKILLLKQAPMHFQSLYVLSTVALSNLEDIENSMRAYEGAIAAVDE